MTALMGARSKIGLAVGAALIAGAGLVLSEGFRDPYQIDALVPTATGLTGGSDVRIRGESVGSIKEVTVEGDVARLKLELDPAHGPLHAGTVANIRWNSLLGRRYVDLEPGAGGNPELPAGSVVEAATERVELDDILAALDAPTRAKVKSLVGSLDEVLADNDQNLNQTLEAAGPFLEALGEVLAGVGKDDEAIRNLVTELHGVTKSLADHRRDVAGSVHDLRLLMDVASRQSEQLNVALSDLPKTLKQANKFLGHVPDATDAATPMLEDLQPAIEQLPGVSRQLRPVVADLRPAVADLRPTLEAADVLLQRTPGLLNIATTTVPELDTTLTTYQPAVSFLRPYTPELVGWLTNWSSVFAPKNAAGHFARAMVPVSASSFNSNPGILPPGLTQGQEPDPGELIGQPWVDANGDGIR